MINLAIVVVHVEMGVTRLAIGALVNQTDTSQFYWRSGAPVTYSSWVPQWDGNRLNGMYLNPFGQPGLDYPIRVAYGICTALEPAFLTSAWTLPGQYYHLQTTLVQSLNATYLLPGFYYSVPTFLV